MQRWELLHYSRQAATKEGTYYVRLAAMPKAGSFNRNMYEPSYNRNVADAEEGVLRYLRHMRDALH